MMQWFEQLSVLQQIYAFIAIPSTLILLIQTVLLLFGIGDGDAEVDADLPAEFGGDGLALFTVRGIMAFLCIGGWTGIFFASLAIPELAAIFLSLLCGAAALVGMAYMIKAFMKMQSAGNLDVKNAVGKIGQAYIPIPANGAGVGKVNLVVQGIYSELGAITHEEETIKTGETVRVVDVQPGGLLVVERVKKDVKIG